MTDKINKTSRKIETREKVARPRGWVPPSNLEAPEPPEGGLALMRCPVEVKEDRDEYFRNLTNQKTEAIENDLHKEEHPSMPIHQERQSRVTFGGGKKS
mgnify:CR=1 FL=1